MMAMDHRGEKKMKELKGTKSTLMPIRLPAECDNNVQEKLGCPQIIWTTEI